MLLIEQIENLFNRQLQNWQLVRENYAALNRLASREVIIPIKESMQDSRIVLQYNPERLRSSSASIDDASLIQRAGIDLAKLTDTQRALADVNGDGRVSILDVTCVQKYLAEYTSGTGKTGAAYTA